MNFIAKFKNYKLKFREKFNNPCYRQFIRLIKMFSMFTSKSIKNGVIKVMINLTYKCQCACDYCWCGNYEKQVGRELCFSELKFIIDQVAQYPSLFTLISFIGGEPLLRDDIYQLIRYTHKKGLFVEIETNGIFLSKINAGKLKKSGLNHIFVRIEGSNEERHDSISKTEGCFKKAIEGIKNCIEKKLSCSIFMNASKEKIRGGEIMKIINLAKKLKVNSVRIIDPKLSGKWLKEDNQMLNIEEEFELKKFLEPDFVYLESSYTATKESSWICPSLQKKFFHISCYGEVQPCPFVPISFGNLQLNSLSEILNNMWEHQIFKENYTGCLINNAGFRSRYILPAHLEASYRNIAL